MIFHIVFVYDKHMPRKIKRVKLERKTVSEMSQAELILRIAVFGEYLGHGVFAILGKQQWIGWMHQMTGLSLDTSGQLMALVGLLDVVVAVTVLFKPMRFVLVWATIWGFWTALLRPLVGEPVWDFVERWANWGAPLALLLLKGWPKKAKEWVE